MRIWKLIYLGEMISVYGVFRDIELLTDNELKERFKQAIDKGQLCEETIEEYNLDSSQDYDIETIVKIFQADGYTIDSVKIEPKVLCPHCNKEVVRSETKDYIWQCLDCDEDFYDFEVKKEY